MTRSVAFVLKGYPRLSETFIAQEIRGLEARGLRLRLYSLRRPTDRAQHPIHREIVASVSYLPEYLWHAPARVWRAWHVARRLPGYGAARARWLADLMRDPTPNRVRRFGQALVLAAEAPDHVAWVHAHFLHTPASVARYAALLRGLPWSASAHAKDIWTTPEWELREKLAESRWTVTCSALNRDRLRELAADPARVDLVYHGLDLARFAPPPPRAAAGGPVRILSVGRAVAKKGYDDLIVALARLKDRADWTFVHVGGGPLAKELKRAAEAAGIAARIAWLGPQPQDRVLAELRAADLFVLASRIAADGDRDGLPNVLMEAQSQGLCCVATRTAAIPELIEDGRTGLLAPPADPAALAAALVRALDDGALRERLGEAGRARVAAEFSAERGIAVLAERFRRSLAGAQ